MAMENGPLIIDNLPFKMVIFHRYVRFKLFADGDIQATLIPLVLQSSPRWTFGPGLKLANYNQSKKKHNLPLDSDGF